MAAKGKCFVCQDESHWKMHCPWFEYPCVLGCGDSMAICWSKQDHSKDCRFLSCKGSPKCKGFKWIDQPPNNKLKEKASSSAATKEGTLKLSIGGKLPMTVEGSTSDITELLKKLQL
ncbi:hypothetical protein ACHQM5_024918 [Ranunculus cassubicifolius]